MNEEFKDIRSRDLRHVDTGTKRRIDAFTCRLVDTAFSVPGVILFLAGIVFAFGIVAR